MEGLLVHVQAVVVRHRRAGMWKGSVVGWVVGAMDQMLVDCIEFLNDYWVVGWLDCEPFRWD